MKRYSSEDAFYQRMRNLADVKNTSILNESKEKSLGTLVNYKKAIDGINYGIIKENHNYYIKKAGTQETPDISDFAYIGGLENKTDFQYKSLAEADKNRNMIFNTINESYTQNTFKTKKTLLSESVEEGAEEEIEKAEQKIEDLETATDDAKASAEEKPVDDIELVGGADVLSAPDNEELPIDEPEIDGDIPMDEPEGDSEETDEITPEDEETSDADVEDLLDDDPIKEIEKLTGKLGKAIRDAELEPATIKGTLNSVIAAFKDKLPEVEIEDRKKMAKDILKGGDEPKEDELTDLGVDIEQEEMGLEESETCNECGGFAQYAESRGYNSESIWECDEEEIGNVISGYATAYSDGENDGDKEVVAKFISLMPKVLEILRDEYGHEEYADELESMVDSEADEEGVKNEINELFAGLKHLGQKAVQGVGGAIQKGAEKVGQAATKVKQSYYAGEKNAAIKKAQEMADELGAQIAKVNAKAKKAGEDEIPMSSIMQVITNNLTRHGKADLSKFKTAESVEDEKEQLDEKFLNMLDLMKNAKNLTGKDKEEYDALQSKLTADGDLSMADSIKLQNLLKNASKDTSDMDRLMKAESISEQKFRKYVRNRLNEKFNKTKSNLNEGKKSEKLKKIDEMIDKEFEKILKLRK